ncbi:hypothetical protein GQX73_g8171 [Xylaria multiplex]|uniref:Rhodopsin domain-containing protein n=1 Tax=Xylaria multiplex TaxID=323545 RepID=A0A7C8IWD9_9PEZI|nr:hypothetical protein GQX73_g8171 [Xylaria multiplex]
MSLAQLPFLPPAEQQAILEGAALPPPPGKLSAFDNPPNNNALALAVAILGLSVSSILLLFRAYTRIFVLRTVRIEDAIGLVAFVSYAAYMYCVFRFMRHVGFFVHQWDLQVKAISEFKYILLIGANFYDANILCIKVAILLDWLHIFVPGKTRNKFFWACWAILTINTLYYIANIVAVNLSCIPFEASWNILVAGRCLDQKALDTSSAVINLISDLTIMALAQQVIWNLHMSLKTKLGLSLIFAAGLFGTVSGLFRIIVTVEYQHHEDTTYTVAAVILWAIGEMTSGFLVFCVPAIPKAIGSIGNGIAHIKHYRLRSRESSQKSKSSFKREGPWKSASPDSSNFNRRKIYHPDEVPITTFSSNASPESESAEQLTASPEPPTTGIVRTTRVVTAIGGDVASQGVKLMHSRQHPWMTQQQ